MRRVAAAGGFGIAIGLGGGALWISRAAGGLSPWGALWVVAGLLFAGVGALIVSRRAGNAVGVLCLIGGDVWLLNMANSRLAEVVAHGPGQPPAWAAWSAWVASWNYLPMMALLGLLVPAVFPTGRFASARWRWIVGLVLLATAAACLATMVRPGIIPSTGERYVNPVGIAALGGIPSPDAMAGLIPIMFVIGALSVTARFRGSSGVERAQLKWFFAAAAGVAVSIPVMIALEAAGLPPLASEWPMVVAFCLVPIAIGIAVLRHGLYEIDRVISRTLAYAVISGVLIAVYAGAVVLLGQVLTPLTRQSDVAVAASTLLVAALFQPVRHRVQAAVDRRFNRSRYDAHRSVEAFAARLREQVDLDELSSELLTVIGGTVAPARAGLWLRGAP